LLYFLKSQKTPSNICPTFFLPLLQLGGSHLEDPSQVFGSLDFSRAAALSFPHPGSRGGHQEEDIAGVQTGGGRIHLEGRGVNLFDDGVRSVSISSPRPLKGVSE